MDIEAYKNLFRGYGNSEIVKELRPYMYLYNPKHLRTAKEVAEEDARANRTIAELESYIAMIRFHRQQLAARYGELETMGYTLHLELERYPTSYNGIKYYLRMYRLMEDGTKVYEINKTYHGKERREAIEAFREIQNAHPGIISEMDIAKKGWEK